MSKDILSFLEESMRLKRMVRSGWIYSGVPASEVESVADHSYFVTLISLLLALDEQKKGTQINIEKTLIMALLHDLSESVSQDIDRRVRKFSPEKYDAFKKELDKNAFNSLLEKLPDDYIENLNPIYDEFLEGKSLEAKIVGEVDRLEMIIQLREYIKLGYNKANFQEFFDNLNEEKDNYHFKFVKDIATKLLEK